MLAWVEGGIHDVLSLSMKNGDPSPWTKANPDAPARSTSQDEYGSNVGARQRARCMPRRHIPSKSYLPSIRHATEMFLLFQHLSSHACLCMRLGVQLMQNEPEPDFQPHTRQLQDLP